MNTFSFKGMLMTAAFAATTSIAFAEPAQTITLMNPTPLQQYSVESLYTLETEWSAPVMVNASAELQVLTIGQEEVATAHFVAMTEASTTAVLQLSEAVTADGVYQISIPVGTVYDGMTYDESMATNGNTIILISVENGGGEVSNVVKLLSVIPADGSTVKELSHFSTTWEVGDMMLSGQNMVLVKNAAGEIVSKGDLLFDWDDPTLFTIDFIPVVTESGDYTVEIPEGALVDDFGNEVNEAVTLHYTIEGEGPVEPVNGFKMLKSEPEAGKILTSLSSLITWWDDEEPALTWTKEVVVVDANGNECAKAYGDYNYTGDANEIDFKINPVITEKGVYTVRIPEGYMESMDGTELNAETNISFTVDPDYVALFTDFEATNVTPANGSTVDANDQMGKSTLTSINITFPTFPYIKDGYEFVFTNEAGEQIPTTKQITMQGAGNIIILGLPEDIASGKYTLSIPEGVVGNKEWADTNGESGRRNPAMEFSWDYIAKNVTEIPDWVLNDPLVIEELTMTTKDGAVVNFLAEDVAVEMIPDGADIAVRTNKDEYAGSILLRVIDNMTGNAEWTAWTLESKDPAIPSVGIKDENGVFHFTKTRDLEFYSDRTYRFVVEAYELYEVDASLRKFFQGSSITFRGLTAPIVYSDVDIYEITPDPEEWEIEDINDRSFTIVYSAPVNIITMPEEVGGIYTCLTEGMYGTVDFEKIESNEDKTEWTFTFPENKIASAQGNINVMIVANDMDGLRVYPEFCEFNNGTGANACQLIHFTSYLGCANIDVVPGAGIVNELYEFEFTAPDAIRGELTFSGMGDKVAANAILYNEAGEEVARMDRDDVIEEDDGAASDAVVNKLTMHLDKKITEEGKYTLYLQPGFITTGREYDAVVNKPIYIDYTVTTVSVGEVEAEASIIIGNGEITVNGVDGTVEAFDLAGVKVASEQAVNGVATITLAKGSYVIVANGVSTVVML